jgi:hypothetical protein
MIEFEFTVNRSFLDYVSRPITVPKEVYGELEATSIVGTENVRITCPDGSLMSGHIYGGHAGYGFYYQIRVKTGHADDPLSRLTTETKINVRIYEDEDRITLGIA